MHIDGQEIDVRLIVVSQGADAGIWANHTVLTATEGKRQHDIPRDVQTMLERAEGKRGVLRATLLEQAKKSGAKVEVNDKIQYADPDTWSRLMLLCLAEIEGYVISGF